jgi:hypothetical protein
MFGSSTAPLPDGVRARSRRRISGALAALLLLPTLIVGCRGRTAPSIPQLPTRPVVTAESLAQALAARIAALENVRGPFVLSVTEQELTSYALGYLAGTPIQDLVIWLEPEGLHVQATFDAAGGHSAHALVAAACQEGVVQLGLPYVALDGHAVPRWIRASAEKAVNDALVDIQAAFRIERIELSEGKALIYGTID